ncbi:uncharacterized protein LOC131949701 [Physella acuta]|uniref:uncharacterized protein LOC131949701 n=1 Tax=Physella acuta TaxID=109671 RepID=UPI0027DBB221|nr:uncharacterized protein LOC131949701 [Physella acuta]
MAIEIPWYDILSAGLAITTIACVTLNAVVLPVMVVIRWSQGSNQTKNIIKTSLWLTLWVSELFNSMHYIGMFIVAICKQFDSLHMYIDDVSPITAILYATGLIGLNVEMILRPYLRRFRIITLAAVAYGCFFAPGCLALVLVLSQYSLQSLPEFYYLYDTWVSVFNLVLNTLALFFSCHLTCSRVMRSRFAATRLASARIQQPGESGSVSLASQGVNKDFPRNLGSINSGSSNVDIEEQISLSGTTFSVAEIDSSRLLLENSITSPEASSSTLRHREDDLGLPQNVVGSNPSDHVEPLNNPPPYHVMVSPQEETEAEETTSPLTPLLPQTDSNISAFDDDPKKESVNILAVTLTSAILMYPFWIVKLINESDFLGLYMITLQLSCSRSLILASMLISFLPTSVRRINSGVATKKLA